jgi:hypothetical protein
VSKKTQSQLVVSEPDAVGLQPDAEDLAIIAPTIKGEQAKCYRAFLDFCATGFSLAELRSAYAKQVAAGLPVPTTERAELSRWYDAFSWAQRRANYDLQRAAAMEREFSRLGEEGQRSMMALKQKMMDRATQMLDYPIEETTVTETILVTQEMVGKEIPTITVVKPADWNMNTTATMLNSIVSTEKVQRTDTRFMISELKRQGFVITTADGNPVVPASDILDAQE